jgi:hypothetical protein
MGDQAEANLPSKLAALDRPAPLARNPRAIPLLPHSLEAEKGILCAALAEKSVLRECQKRIAPDWIADPICRLLYGVMLDLFLAGEPLDFITLPQILRDKGLLEKVGGIGFLTELLTFGAIPEAIGYYLDIVEEKYALRQLIQIGKETLEAAADIFSEPQALINVTESQLAKLRDSLQGANGAFPPIEDAARNISAAITLPPDVIVGLLHRGGKMVLGGASKSFKTWLLIDTALSVATGTDWLGRLTTQAGRVLYLNFEIPKPFFDWRLKTICDERQLTLGTDSLRIWNLRGYAADLSQISTQILRGIGSATYALIILDPAYKLYGARNENEASAMADLMNEIEHLAVKTGAAAAFGAHYSKGNQAQKEAIDRISGSSVFGRDPDTIVNFTTHEEKDCFSVESILRNHPPIDPFVVRWHFPLMTTASELDPKKLKLPGRPEIYHASELLDLITEPMSATEIVNIAQEELGMSNRKAFEFLKELKEKGLVNQPTPRGKYVVK